MNDVFTPGARPVAGQHTGGAHPLGLVQTRFWFLAELEAGSPSYHVPLGLDLTGPLRPRALQQALDRVIERHPLLRTRYPATAGTPMAVEQDPAPLPLEHAEHPSTDIDAADLQRFVSAFVRRPFDLARDWPLRALLVQLGGPQPQRHLLLLVFHHIAIDGWALATLQRDLWACYRASLSGLPPRLPVLPVSFREFADWQRQWLHGDRLRERLSFWRAQLRDADPGLPLPTDRPRPARRSDAGGLAQHPLSEITVGAVQGLATACGATPFMVLTAALQLLLFRYSGQPDISIGTPVSNRSRLPRQWRNATRDLVGPLMNTIVLRQRLTPDARFRELLAELRQTTIAALAHQDLPLEKLVEDLQGPRDLGSNPLFQVLLSLEDAPARIPDLAGLSVTPFEVATGSAKFDLSITVSERAHGALVKAEYSRDLFDHASIERLLTHYIALLDRVTASPDQRLSAFALIDDEERRQLLQRGQTPPIPTPATAIYPLFRSWLARRADAPALWWRGAATSYRELDRDAEAIAAGLRRRGVAPVDGTTPLVGLLLNRGPRMVAALLATLRCGAAYLPLAPSYPAERLRWMVDDARPVLLVTESDLAGRLPPGDPPRWDLDQNPPTPPTPPDAPPPAAATDPDTLAYLIYTSGSTGRPKGVMVTHRNLVTLVDWAGRHYRPEQLAGVLAATPLSFDLSVFELLVPLCVGGSLVLADSILDLPRLADAARVTLINAVPSAVNQLLDDGDLPPGVTTVNLAGEPLTPALVDRLYRQPGVERVYDLYGPTEDGVYSTCALRRPGAPARIGRPLPGKSAYVLDPFGALLPDGVPGELWLGGGGVSAGYLKRADLTAQRYADDPFVAPGDTGDTGDKGEKDATGRMYRSGDRVRWCEDGQLEFLGRLDAQLKLRGFRIEPGEIESVLAEHPAVGETVVLLRSGAAPGAGPGLVAYLTRTAGRNDECALDVAALRAFAAARLPDWMVPTAFVELPQLPRHPNGKLDRAALPTPPTSADAHPADRQNQPDGDLQQAIAALFCEVLGVGRVGPRDDFFALGGHSLLATRVIGALNQRFDLTLPLTQLFASPTVAELASALSDALADAATQGATPGSQEWDEGLL